MKAFSAHALGYVWHSNDFANAAVKHLMGKTIVTRQQKNTNAPFQAISSRKKAVFIFLFCVLTILINDMCQYVIIKDGAEDLTG